MLEPLNKGDANEAARALLALTPDANALVSHYAKLIQAAETAQGEMNIDDLVESYGGRDPWRTCNITDKVRRRAILQWISCKLWEIPTGESKQVLVDRYMIDIRRFIDSQVISSEFGLLLAYNTILPSYGILPDVSTSSLADLLKKYADSNDRKTREYVRLKLTEVMLLLDSPKDSGRPKMEQTFQFLKAHFPDRRWPNTAMDLFRFGSGPFAGAVSRKEYDAISHFTPRQSYAKLLDVQCDGEKCVHTVCSAALEGLVTGYDTDPKEVTGYVKALLGQRRYIRQLGFRVLGPAAFARGIDADTVEAHGPLINVVLDAYSCILGAPISESFNTTTSTLGSYLDRLQGVDLEKRKPSLVKLDERCAELLVSSVASWERLRSASTREFHGDSPMSILTNKWPKLYPETQKYVKDFGQEILKTTKSYADLPKARQDAVEKALSDIIAMP